MGSRATTYSLAAWAMAASLALLWQWAPSAKLHPFQAPRAQGEPGTGDAHTAAPHSPAPFAGRPMVRYGLCRTAGTPQVYRLTDPPNAVVIHCGKTVRLVRFFAGQAQVQWDFAASMVPADAQAVPAPVLSFDENGDGRTDLLIGQRYQDAAGNPAGGKVSVLHGSPRGSFGPPKTLLLAYPLRLLISRSAQDAAPELFVVHGRNAHHGFGPELWTYTRSAAPPREVRGTLPTGTRVLANLDIDLDGRQEWLAAGKHDAEAGLWILPADPRQSDREPRFFALGPITAAAVGDINGDGRSDALIAGEQLWTLQAAAGPEQDPQPVARSQCPTSAERTLPCHRDPEILPLSEDVRGALFKSYNHPEVQLFRHMHSPSADAPRTLTLEGHQVAVLATFTIHADGDGLLDLGFIVRPKGSPEEAQLALLPNFAVHEHAAFGPLRGPLPKDWLHMTDPL